MKKYFILMFLGLSINVVTLNAENYTPSETLELNTLQDNNWSYITTRNAYYNNQGIWFDQNVEIYKDPRDGSIWIKTTIHGVGKVEKNPDYAGTLTFLKGGYRTNKKYRAQCGSTYYYLNLD